MGCSACSGIGSDSCVRHGKEYVVSKFECWGTTHFCKKCHDRQEAHDYMTTKPVDKLPKCPGPEKCPLGIKHAPNGQEFSLGCALCRGSDVITPVISQLPQNEEDRQNVAHQRNDN